VTSLDSGDVKICHRIYRLSLSAFKRCKFGIYHGEWAMRDGAYLGLWAFALCLIIMTLTSGASAQQPVEAAFVRGQFSEGNGTWQPDNFGWFYYDVDKDVGGERLSVNVMEERLAEKGDVIYSSTVWPQNFEYKPWGSYNAVAFLGKPYLASYPASTFTDEVSSLGKGELRAVLIDNNDTHTLTYNDTLPLLDGYFLALKEISQSGDVANLVLFKNQKPVHMAAVSTGGTYVFKIENIPIILVHVAKAMRSNNSGVVEVDGIFQISDTPDITLVEGAKLGEMELTDLSENQIELRNDNGLTLTRNSIVPLIDGLSLVMLDLPNLVYYPQGSISDYGVHEIRGPVYTENSALPLYNSSGAVVGRISAKWDFDNFSGFYFDPEDVLGRETMSVENVSGRSIAQAVPVIKDNTFLGLSGGVQYNTVVEQTQFKFRPWGYYYVIGFLGQPWFAGYSSETSSDIGNVNIIQQYKIGQIIHDSDDTLPLSAGRALTLGEGYEFGLVSVNGDKAAVALSKNGVLVESAVLKANSTYRYKKDVEDVKDLPIIAVHVQNVFSDGRNESIMVNGLFQISEENFLPVDFGRKFDKMVILPTPPGYVSMANLDDRINLGRDTSTSIWPGMYLRSADNDTLRYYIYALQYVVPSPKMARDVGYTPNVPSGGRANFNMIVNAGAIDLVTAEIEDPLGRTVNVRDLTNIGQGSEDLWGYFWTWNATVLRMSDDSSPVLDTDSSIPALLYINKQSGPLQVSIRLDSNGRIASIANNRAIYYLSPTGYKLINTSESYSEMLANSTSRTEFIKIQPGSSIVKLLDILNGTTRMSGSNHTLTGPIESLEPHAVRIGAPPGRYELRARIENAVNAIRVSGVYFNVTASNATAEPVASLGSSTIAAGGQVMIPLNATIIGEKRIEIHYDPAVLNATGISGPCNASLKIDRDAGNIMVIMPAGCSSANLSFMAKEGGVISSLNITRVNGVLPERVINGSITVVSNEKKSSDGPTCIAALAALVIVALARRKG
jgi:S-layer protein (TIGR01567 family)